MKTLPIDDHNQGIFSHKLGHFFPIFEKGQEKPPPSLPLVTRLLPIPLNRYHYPEGNARKR